MKNLRKAELIVIGVTFLILSFTAGFFTGRGTGKHVITFDQLADPPAVSAVVETAKTDMVGASSGVNITPGQTPSASSSQSSAPSSTAASAVSLTTPGAPPPDVENQEITSEAAAKLNLNTATFSQLVALPGIGDVLAGRILDYRQQLGGFKSTGQIMDVDGIGQKKFDAIKDLITV